MAIKGQKWKQNRSIKPEEFVKVFVTKKTYEEIATHFNISIHSVKTRAYSLRKLGVKLDTKKKNRKYDVELLNRIIKKYNK